LKQARQGAPFDFLLLDASVSIDVDDLIRCIRLRPEGDLDGATVRLGLRAQPALGENRVGVFSEFDLCPVCGYQ